MTTLLLYSNTFQINLLNATVWLNAVKAAQNPFRLALTFTQSVSGLTKTAFPHSKTDPVSTLAKRRIDVTYIVGAWFEEKS